jgi:hypothetical protein
MTGDGNAEMPPLFALTRGQTCVLDLNNETAWWHPMHLHGHSFNVLNRNGAPVPHDEWRDTVLVPPREHVQIAFVADNPGDSPAGAIADPLADVRPAIGTRFSPHVAGAAILNDPLHRSVSPWILSLHLLVSSNLLCYVAPHEGNGSTAEYSASPNQ